MKSLYTMGAVLILAFLIIGPSAAQNGIDPEALIARILAVDSQQRNAIHDLILDAEYVEGEHKKDKGFVEKVKFEKKIYIKYEPDTTKFFEDYRAYYKDGKAKSEKDLRKQARERRKKKKKRKAHDISYAMLKPFYPDQRGAYEIDYLGVSSEEIENQVCHQFRVTSKVKDSEHINGNFFFEADGFHLVRVDCSPAKLVKKTMFKMKELKMSIVYRESPEGFWLPSRFDISGKGKAMFLIGVKFAGTEYYRNPIVNSGISDDVFEVRDGE